MLECAVAADMLPPPAAALTLSLESAALAPPALRVLPFGHVQQKPVCHPSRLRQQWQGKQLYLHHQPQQRVRLPAVVDGLVAGMPCSSAPQQQGRSGQEQPEELAEISRSYRVRPIHRLPLVAGPFCCCRCCLQLQMAVCALDERKTAWACIFHQLPYMNVHAWAVKQARLHVPPHARIPVSLLPAEQAVKLAAHPCCKLNECLHCVYKFGTPELGEQCPPRGVQMELLHWLHQKNSGRRCTQVAPEYWIAANRSGGCGSVNVLRCYGNVAFVAVATAATAAAGAAGAAC